MTKPGPSPEYRDLLKGKISAEEYVRKLKKDVERRLRPDEASRRARRAAAG